MGTPESARHRIFAASCSERDRGNGHRCSYKGTGPALNDLIGGQFDSMCDQTLNVFQPISRRADQGLRGDDQEASSRCFQICRPR